MLGGGSGGGLLSNPSLQVTLLLLALDIPQGWRGTGGGPAMPRASECGARRMGWSPAAAPGPKSGSGEVDGVGGE